MTRDLVVGDIVEIEEYMSAPADCLVLKQNYCNFSEAAITGSAENTPKSTAFSEKELEEFSDPFILSGSLCT